MNGEKQLEEPLVGLRSCLGYPKLIENRVTSYSLGSLEPSENLGVEITKINITLTLSSQSCIILQKPFTHMAEQ